MPEMPVIISLEIKVDYSEDLTLDLWDNSITDQEYDQKEEKLVKHVREKVGVFLDDIKEIDHKSTPVVRKVVCGIGPLLDIKLHV